MTFSEFESFVDYCIETEQLDVLEINPPEDNNDYVTIHNLENTDPLIVTEMLISAYDSGFHIGSFFADRDNGSVTIRE